MMVTVESTGTLERRMRVELPAERIEKEVESRLQRVARTAKIKGFRPGKIPAKVVRKHYGVQVRQEVLSDLMQKSYSDAVQQENLSPAGGPQIEPVSSGDGEDFAYVATFEVLPEVTLTGLDKIKVERPVVEIGDSDCDEMLENLRKQRATWATVERAAKDGDRVIVDFDGTINGESIAGGKGDEVPVELGKGQMLPDFEKGLSGVKAGDEKTIKVKFPKDYHAEELQDKKVDFALKIHRVEEQELPPLDDSLAEMYGVAEGGLERLKQDVLQNMRREVDDKVRNDVKEQVMDALLKSNPIDVPKALVDQEAHSMQHEAMRRMGVEDHSQAPPRENFKEAAERRVRLGLLLRQYLQDQKLSVDAGRVRSRVEEICASYENASEMVANYLSNPQLMQQLEPLVLEEQAVEQLVKGGTEKEKKVAFSKYMND
ncbi:trigger factor [Woeseia oceani]|uniref:Trigger factor n=1 Tax=Woeseia oceani TaxID=1548547 RepID=A0A193LKL1_9GAMM|nr:trigger factor [Woeseia oceani]ANO53052.1 trigger factor [Woeseia oceani]